MNPALNDNFNLHLKIHPPASNVLSFWFRLPFTVYNNDDHLFVRPRSTFELQSKGKYHPDRPGKFYLPSVHLINAFHLSRLTVIGQNDSHRHTLFGLEVECQSKVSEHAVIICSVDTQ